MHRLLLGGVLVLGSMAAALGGEKTAPNTAPDALRGEPIYTRCLAGAKERADLIADLKRVNEMPDCGRQVAPFVLPAVEGVRR